MNVKLTKEDLQKFQEQTAQDFCDKKILAPVHLCDGNEDELIYLFSKLVGENDWILSTWRSSYHALLKGVPPEDVRKEILAGNSIALQFPAYRVLSSAIVGGSIPIGLGIAWTIKNSAPGRWGMRERGVDCPGEDDKVWVFVGDAGSFTGAFYESYQYAKNFDLPIRYVVENNMKSVCTDTMKTWGLNSHPLSYKHDGLITKVDDYLYYYEYNSKYPHSGPTGKRIVF